MIAYIRGKIIDKTERSLVIDTGNLGYEVFVNTKLMNLDISDDVALFTYFQVKEDAFLIYGFEKREEKDFFTKLISVSGVGGRTAIEILEFDLSLIKKAILEEDANFISQVKGLGKKTAQKIIIELKSKIDEFEVQAVSMPKMQNQAEIQDALLSLGFTKKEILSYLKALPEDIQKTEDVIRWFLKKMH
ncbi:MAG: Holliday junction branch migration protein RuvA [Candidatus Gracilibacteria bacterium]|jgi:Holliday junction DNA helicase RuvA|nr:Holliday junction branch migration protein RuvA [Candidatus Gracilibacteria bacterium]